MAAARNPKPVVLYAGGKQFPVTQIIEHEGEKVEVPRNDWLDDLSGEERFAIRRIGRELSGDPRASIDSLDFEDLAFALKAVIERRVDPEYGLADALKLTVNELTSPPPKATAS